MTTPSKKKAAPKKTAKAAVQLNIVGEAMKKIDLPAEFNMTQAALAKLKDQYDPSLIPVASEKGDEGYLIVHEACMQITSLRTGIEKRRKELKADSLAWGKKVDGEAKVLTDAVLEIEKPWRKIKEDLDEKEKRKAEEQAAAEAQRQANIEAAIKGIQRLTEGLLNATADDIADRLKEAEQVDIVDTVYGEFCEVAELHKTNAINSLSVALEQRRQFETQQAGLAEAQRKQAEDDRRRDEEAEKLRQEREAFEREKKEAAEAEEKRKQAEADEKRKAEEQSQREKEEAKRAEQLKARLPQDMELRDYVNDIYARVSEFPVLDNPDLVEICSTFTDAVKAACEHVYNEIQEGQV